VSGGYNVVWEWRCVMHGTALLKAALLSLALLFPLRSAYACPS
jgi:hypothetical protein